MRAAPTNKQTRRRRFPTARLGGAVAAGASLLAAGALWWPLLWLDAAWWAALLALVTADWQGVGRAAVSATRAVSPILSLGVENPVRLELRNRSNDAWQCLVRDEPPLDFAVVGDRRLACNLPAGDRCELAYAVTPPRRGDYAFGKLNVRLQSRLGLVTLQLAFDAAETVKVYPNLAHIASLELAARQQRLADLGVHHTRLYGAGLEFEHLRPYVTGDEMRRIDWKATARRDDLVAREYEVQRSQHVIICLDLGRTMASELGLLRKADHAVNAAALLAHVAAKGGDWVGLYAFADGPVAFVPPRKQQFSLVLDKLYDLQPREQESDYQGSFLDAGRRLRKRSLVVLLTDLPDPDSSARLIAYAHLLTRRHLVLCAALSDYELYDLAARSPAEPRQLYERTVAVELLADRQRALAALRRLGAIAFDATPSNLSVEVLNRYLEIKARAKL